MTDKWVTETAPFNEMCKYVNKQVALTLPFRKGYDKYGCLISSYYSGYFNCSYSDKCQESSGPRCPKIQELFDDHRI